MQSTRCCTAGEFDPMVNYAVSSFSRGQSFKLRWQLVTLTKKRFSAEVQNATPRSATLSSRPNCHVSRSVRVNPFLPRTPFHCLPSFHHSYGVRQSMYTSVARQIQRSFPILYRSKLTTDEQTEFSLLKINPTRI